MSTNWPPTSRFRSRRSTPGDTAGRDRPGSGSGVISDTGGATFKAGSNSASTRPCLHLPRSLEVGPAKNEPRLSTGCRVARTTIDRRGNGRYRARYEGPDRTWRSRTFDRRIDAQRWLSNELVKLDRGEWVDPRAGRTPFAFVAERWMAGRIALRETTQARDRSYLDSLVLPYLGDRPVGGVSPSDLEAWVADLNAEGKAPATVQ